MVVFLDWSRFRLLYLFLAYHAPPIANACRAAKNKCLADRNKPRTSAKPTNDQSAPQSFHPPECRSHSGPRQPFAALTRDHLTPEQARIATAWLRGRVSAG